MKIIIISANPKHGLLNGQEWVAGHRPAVTTHTPLLEQRMAKGDFKLLIGNLSDEATDAELVEFLKNSDQDRELALAAFESRYSLEESRRETSEQRDARIKKIEDLAKAEKEAEDKRLKDAEEKRLKDAANPDPVIPVLGEAKKN